MARPLRRPLSLRSVGLAWFAVSFASVVPEALAYVPVALVGAILFTWGRGRTWHLWTAAAACQVVAFVRDAFDPLGAWLTGVLLGGFPALAVGLLLWWLADRRRLQRVGGAERLVGSA